MKFSAQSYRSSSGLRAYRRQFLPTGTVRAGAVFIHGLGEHSGRHQRHLELFAHHGIHCIAFDLPGHGLTGGPRGHIASLEIVQQLIDENAAILRTEIGKNRHLGLLGHSMGGLLSLDYLTRFPNEFDFSWISSPLIDPASKASWLKLQLVMMIERVHPKFTLHGGVNSRLCKRDEAELASTRTDELVHRQMTVRLGSILIQSSYSLQENAMNMHAELKLLMTHGGNDQICRPEPARALFDRLPCMLKDYTLFPDLLHEPFNDTGKEAVYERLESWVSKDLLPGFETPSIKSRSSSDLAHGT